MKNFSGLNGGRILAKLWVPILALTMWEIFARIERNFFIPPISQILLSSREVIDLEWIERNVPQSLTTLLGGFLIGSFSGVVAGIGIALNQRAREVFLPIAHFLRAIPSVAKVPVFIAIFGLSTFTRVTTVSFATFFVVLLSTIEGVSRENQEYLALSQINRLSWGQKALFIQIPGAVNEILTGLHVALQISVVVMVFSEMLGSGIGIGAFIFQSQSTFNVSHMWVGMLVTGLLGLILNTIFLLLEKNLFQWRVAIERDL